MYRFHSFLLFLGHPPYAIRDVSVHRFSKILSEFALEYRTTRERVLQQKQKRASHRERNKTRGKMITDVSLPTVLVITVNRDTWNLDRGQNPVCSGVISIPPSQSRLNFLEDSIAAFVSAWHKKLNQKSCQMLWNSLFLFFIIYAFGRHLSPICTFISIYILGDLNLWPSCCYSKLFSNTY